MTELKYYRPVRKHDPDFVYIDDLEVSHHCQAHTFNPETQKFDGPRCRSWVKPGHKLCRRHGGNIVRNRTKASLRQNEYQIAARARNRLSNNGLTPIEDVYAALEQNQAYAQAFLEICQERLQAITGGDDDWRYKSTAGEQLRAEVALYERAMERVHKFMVDYVKLGIADRRVKVAEAQALILVGVIQNILGRLDLSRDQKRIAATVVPEELRAISAGPERE